MKRMFIILLLIVFIFLVGCTNPSNKVEPWCEDDFLFYDAEGNIAQQPDEDTFYFIYVSSPEDGATHRGVCVGDDAIEALKKYDLSYCYGMAVYGNSDIGGILTADVDIETLITTTEEVIRFDFSFDKEYNPIDRVSSLQSGINPPKELSFVVKDGKIFQIIVFNISPYWLSN